MKYWRTVVLTGALLASATAASGMYNTPDIAQIPLSRLTNNLRQALRKEPKNVGFTVNLARAYAMAWSLGADSVPAQVSDRWSSGFGDPAVPEPAGKPIEPMDAWFGFEPDFVPFKRLLETKDREKRKVANARLDSALTLYAAALAIEPQNLVARLGYAWLLTNTRYTNRAIRELRTVANAKPSPKIDGLKLTAEAAGYLIPLLSPKRDGAEIQRLKDVITTYENSSRVVTPIAIPLRDGLNAADIEHTRAAVRFDADGSGLQRRWSWIRPNAGWLVHDPNRSGRVTSALQLFGSVTFWMFWSNGYDAMASLDDNRDGQLTGRELTGLALWVDANENGISERGEVRTVQQHGITALSCSHRRDARHADRIAYSPDGVTFRNGTTRATYDFVLHQKAEVVAAGR